MSDNGVELRGIAWSQAFPFVRLFQTLRLALDFKRLVLALACVLLTFIGGRILDGVWPRDSRVVVQARGAGLKTEIEAFAEFNQTDYGIWLHQVTAERERIAILALIEAGKAYNQQDAAKSLASSSLHELLADSSKSKKTMKALEAWVDQRLDAGLAVIDKDKEVPKTDRQDRRDALVDAANIVKMVLIDWRPCGMMTPADVRAALKTVLDASPEGPALPEEVTREELGRILDRQVGLQHYAQLAPLGPFRSLLDYESRCFAAAIRGVCTGHWGFSAGAFSAEPAMAGSMVSAIRGVGWLVIRRPWFALLLGLLMLLVFGYFGGALCRSVAVQSARDESIRLGEALKFAAEKYSGFLLAPVLPVVVFIVIGLIMFVGGLVGAIPLLGELLTGVFYPLALLGGFALAIILLATVLGFHLMWPTIAAEGSDGFDALSRACSYIGSRIWHVGFYWFVLLLYGALSFSIVRLVAALMLKLAHTCTKTGMNLDGSSHVASLGKLDGIWTMPAWADLSILPSTGDMPFWGTFHNAPLDWSESIAMVLLRLWVYIVVGLVGAFVVSFFYCGSTQMYFLLRRDVDATDWEEVYYEEPAEGPPAVPAAVLPGLSDASATPTEPAPPPPDQAPPA